MSNKSTIIIIILSLVILGLLAYIFFGNQWGGDFRQPPFRNMSGFSLTDEIKSSTTEFFDSSPSLENAENYCNENRANCFYYCSEINQEHEVCDKIMMPNNRSLPTGEFGGRR